MSNDKKEVSYNNGLIDGVVVCKDEERKLQHKSNAKSKLDIGMFKFPDLNE